MYDQREHERKLRREIANSNERRRMQSINDGFKSLKAILPHPVGDKLSKAAVLQQTADYIYQLDSEKARLLSLNEKYRSALSECSCGDPKRREFISDLFDKDEGIGSPREEDLENLRRDSIELRHQLDKERKLRICLEDKVRQLESETKLREIAQNVQEQFRLVKQPTHCENSPNRVCTNTEQKVVRPQHNDRLSLPSMDTIRLHYSQANLFSSSTSIPVETVPSAGLCVTVGQDHPIQFPPIQVKCADSIPRSSQPFKKRSIEVILEKDTLSPKRKVPKIQAITFLSSASISATQTRPLIASTSSMQPKATILIQRPSKTVAEPLRVNADTSPPTDGTMFQARLQPNTSSLSADLPTHPAAQTYITLAPTNAQTKLTAVQNASVSATPTDTAHTSRYILQPPVQGVVTNSEEITLSQLNSVPSLSMTLTQLNTLPAAARLNTVGSPGGSTMQPQFLPVVAMDTVLSTQDEQAASSNTTSNNENLEKEAENQIRPEHAKVAISERSHSDSAIPSQAMQEKGICLVELNTVKNTPVSHSFPDGPGSPSYAVATRSNLETIVQAIDHLEQQERRNSQDHQINER